MVNFGPLAAETCSRVWGTPANFNGFRVLAALLQGIPVLGVSQTLRRLTDGATYIRRVSLEMQDPKFAKKSPSRHHRTTLSGYIFPTKARSDNRKKIVKQRYVLHMSS